MTPALSILAFILFCATGVHANTPRPLRQHHSIIEYLDNQGIKRRPPLDCLGRSIHPPWQNPFSPLPEPYASRHQRLTVSPGPAAVEYGDALLVEPGERLRFQLVPREDARLELAYRVYRCGQTGPLALQVTIEDALGRVTTRHPLKTRAPRNDDRQVRESAVSLARSGPLRRGPAAGRAAVGEAFTDLVVPLPVAADTPFRLELEVVPDGPDGPREGRNRTERTRRERANPGGLVALIDPTLSGLDPDPSDADTNVLWIVIDAVRHDAMGPGRRFSPSASPELDRRVFSRGTSFTHAYALANQTRTSTVAMLASVPASIGGFHSHAWAFTSGKRETFYQRGPDLVPRVLQRHGFLTRHIGHNHFIWGSEIIGIDHGFQRALDIRAIPQDAIEASRAAVRFFERHRDSRWMMMLNYTAPHTPYRPPEAFLEKAHALTDPPSTERIGFLPRTYLGEILWVDHNLEHVFAALERLDLLENTLVIVTADHGEVMNPAHDCASALLAQPCAYNHGVTVYDDELRVPLAFALPRKVTTGRVVDTRISHIDLAPTILDVLGLPPARRHIGRSLLPALTGGFVPAEAIYADGRLAAMAILGDTKLIVHAAQDDIRPRPRMIDGEPARHELFDLAQDPLELTNLARKSPDLVRYVTTELDQLRAHMRHVFQGGRAPAVEPTPGSSRAETTYHLMMSAHGDARATVIVASDGLIGCRSAAPLCKLLDSHRVELTAQTRDGTTTTSFTAHDGDTLTVTASLSETPWPQHRLRLGPWGLALLRPGQRLDRDHLAWLDTTAPPIPQPRENALYLFRDPPPLGGGDTAEPTPTAAPEDLAPDLDGDQALGGEVKRILKDLGYTR